MIKIKEAHVSPAVDEEDKDTLHVTLDIDGQEAHIGGMPIDSTRESILAYAERKKEGLLAQVETVITKPTLDLIDEEFKPRDALQEVDELKARVSVLEPKVM